MTMFRSGWAFAAVAIVVWGVTFASTRTLLEEFSSFEILVLRLVAGSIVAVCGVALISFASAPLCRGGVIWYNLRP